jgi:sn-1 stearoyl-lipid 9-desaturase
MSPLVLPPREVRNAALATGIGLLVIHLGALAAVIPGTFSWQAVIVAVVLYYVTGGLGVSLCFHRILTHRSLHCPRWLEYSLAVLGTLALQGGPISWIATHRAHHANADREGDPHNIRKGLTWAHIQWLFWYNESRPSTPEKRRLAPELYAQPFYRFLDRSQLLLQGLLGVVLFAAGGWSWVVWGVFVRIVVTYHATWLVNSAAHHSGYRTYRTGDNSTNNWWVGLLSWGEGWHNNHHAFPFSARHGLRWFEVDLTWYVIGALAKLGLARKVRLPTAAMMSRLATRPASSRS